MTILRARDELEERVVDAVAKYVHSGNLELPEIEGGVDDVLYRVALAVDTLHEGIDLSNAFRQNEVAKRSGEIGCYDGCDNCCYQAVKASWPEVVLIAHYINTEGKDFMESIRRYCSEVDVEEVGKLIRSIDLIGEPRFKRQLREKHGDVECPFLEDSSCGIYEVRPITCRAIYFAGPSDECVFNYERYVEDDRCHCTLPRDSSLIRSLSKRLDASPLVFPPMPVLVKAFLEEGTGAFR